jgi:hypothetical protein
MTNTKGMETTKQTAVDFLMDKLFDPSMMVDEQLKWFKEAKEMEKEEMINFHIEVMKLGLNQEGERIWEEAYLPKVSSIATQKYTETYGGNK